MKLTAFVAALLLGSTAMAQTAPAAPTYTFALHGFTSLTGGYQTGLFSSEGQLSNYSMTPQGLKDTGSTTFDVRQSRFNFSVKGPQTIYGATPTGILEIDWMGGPGAGANGLASLATRLRIAVGQLDWGTTKLQFGQQNDLIFAMAPTSLSHIGQPLGYSTGNTGWRRPGIFGFHTLTVAPDTKLELAWEVGRGNWNDTTNTGGITYAEASAMPALEGRATVSYGKLLWAWVGAHHHQVDVNGIGGPGTPVAGVVAPQPHTIPVDSYNAGAKLTFDLKPMTLTLQGTGFMARNGSPLVADFQSFRVGPAGASAVNTIGWWAQAGLNFTKELSVWGFYGMQSIDKKDFVHALGGALSANNLDPTNAAGARYENATANVLAMYRDSSGFAYSLEWINFKTKYATAVDGTAFKITKNRTAESNQFLLSANYFF